MGQLSRETIIHDSIIMFWGDSSAPEYRGFELLSREIGDLFFGFTSSADIQAKYRGTETKSLFTMIRKFEEPIVHLTGNYNLNDLRIFIKEKRYPLIMEFQEKYTKRVFGDKNPTMFLVLTNDQLQRGSATKEFTQAALRLKGKILFATAVKESEWGLES